MGRERGCDEQMRDKPGLSGGQLRRRGPGDQRTRGWDGMGPGATGGTGLGLRIALSETGAKGEIRAASGLSSINLLPSFLVTSIQVFPCFDISHCISQSSRPLFSFFFFFLSQSAFFAGSSPTRAYGP